MNRKPRACFFGANPNDVPMLEAPRSRTRNAWKIADLLPELMELRQMKTRTSSQHQHQDGITGPPACLSCDASEKKGIPSRGSQRQGRGGDCCCYKHKKKSRRGGLSVLRPPPALEECFDGGCREGGLDASCDRPLSRFLDRASVVRNRWCFCRWRLGCCSTRGPRG